MNEPISIRITKSQNKLNIDSFFYEGRINENLMYNYLSNIENVLKNKIESSEQRDTKIFYRLNLRSVKFLPAQFLGWLILFHDKYVRKFSEFNIELELPGYDEEEGARLRGLILHLLHRIPTKIVRIKGLRKKDQKNVFNDETYYEGRKRGYLPVKHLPVLKIDIGSYNVLWQRSALGPILNRFTDYLCSSDRFWNDIIDISRRGLGTKFLDKLKKEKPIFGEIRGRVERKNNNLGELLESLREFMLKSTLKNSYRQYSKTIDEFKNEKLNIAANYKILQIRFPEIQFYITRKEKKIRRAFVSAIERYEENEYFKFALKYYINLLYHLNLLTDLLGGLICKFDNSKIWEIVKKNRGKRSVYHTELYKLVKKELDTVNVFSVMLISLIWMNIFGKIKREEIKKIDIDKHRENINKSFELAKEYAKGIKQLSENIVEHAGKSGKPHRSREGIGTISARIYDDNELMTALDISGGEELNYYLKNKKGVKYLLLNIFDNGENGIIDTTIKTLEPLKESIESEKNIKAQENLRHVYQKEIDSLTEDINKLKSGRLRLKHFFDTGEFHFEHQLLRTIASLGLNIFTKITEDNNGFFMVFSNSKDKKKKDVTISMYNSEPGNTFRMAEHVLPDNHPINNIDGTIYTIILPLDIQKIGIIPHEINYHFETAMASDSFELLVKDCISHIHYTDVSSSTIQHSKRIAVNFTGFNKKYCDKSTAEKEIIEEIVSCISILKNKISEGSALIPLLDYHSFRTCAPDVSSFYRILGHLQLRYGFNGIVIYNMDDDSYKEIKYKILIKYARANINHDTKIWDNEHLLLIYLESSFEPFVIGGNNFFQWQRLYQMLGDIYGIGEEFRDIEEDVIIKRGLRNKSAPKISLADIVALAKNPLLVATPIRNKYTFLPLDLVVRTRSNVSFRYVTIFEKRIDMSLRKLVD